MCIRDSVWGPEYEKEKRQVAISSVRSMDYRTYKNNPNKMKELEKIYDEWYENFKNNKILDKVKGIRFNYQVLAPYLLVYTHNIRDLNDNEDLHVMDVEWIVQASMHGITTAYLCAEKGLNASFCRCFFYSEFLDNKI